MTTIRSIISLLVVFVFSLSCRVFLRQSLTKALEGQGPRLAACWLQVPSNYGIRRALAILGGKGDGALFFIGRFVLVENVGLT